MTREQAESEIMRLLEEIKDIIGEYYPEDGYIDLCINDDVLTFNNQYWEHAGEGVLRAHKIIGKGVSE